MKWYNKFFVKDNSGFLDCPYCNHVYLWEIFYSKEPFPCFNCGHNLFKYYAVEYSCIYTIDVDSAPKLLKIIIDYLQTINDKESSIQMKKILDMISDKDGSLS